MLAAYQFALMPPLHAVVAGERSHPATQAFIRKLQSAFAPNRTLILIDGEPARRRFAEWLPFTAGMKPQAGQPAAYVCRNYTCELPVTDPDQATISNQHFTLEE
jgi:hypothetical protein